MSVAAVLAVGCSEQPTATFEGVADQANLEQQTAYWDNNVLEATDENNDTWRFERDQESATTADLYKNSVYLGTIDLTYVSAAVDTLRFTEPSVNEWIATDDGGTITGSNYGPSGDCSDPEEQPGCEPKDFSFSHDCDNEFDEMQSAAWDAVGTAGVASILTAVSGPANPISIGAIIGAAIETGKAFGKLGQWGACKLQPELATAGDLTATPCAV